MKKLFVGLAAVCVLAGGAFGAGSDPSESGIATSPLKIYSLGLGGGGIYSLNGGGGTFGKVIWLNSFDFTESFTLFADVNWYIGENGLANFGIDLGGDYKFLPYERVSPFFGAGVGARYFDADEFSDAFGVSLTARVGVVLKLTNTIDVKVRVPFHFVINDAKDMGIGAEVGVMFFSNLRNVKSIDY